MHWSSPMQTPGQVECKWVVKSMQLRTCQFGKCPHMESAKAYFWLTIRKDWIQAWTLSVTPFSRLSVGYANVDAGTLAGAVSTSDHQRTCPPTDEPQVAGENHAATLIKPRHYVEKPVRVISAIRQIIHRGYQQQARLHHGSVEVILQTILLVCRRELQHQVHCREETRWIPT